ncbi:hypothetical protein SAMN05216229_10659 [Geopseudomonas sagittaria]|uniref:Uncharacterized protein n=1 Tax=Geopseudomonas sagittaria TaxID=1135990 RepID=A0A1I5TF17_9GAMM|nr:hypothetical protein [Pseudomonas sagittaria]MCM2331039.1 hypothetical protein [Pseudomonas sagittaria]SFP81277.1 hypothetical protein SAMN05216229_10659 [Pseudomonas sagittaria]
MPAYQAPSRDLRFDTREPLDLSRLAGHDRPLQAGEPVAAELRDTVVEAGTSFCVTHAWGLYPVPVPSSASLKQSPAV